MIMDMEKEKNKLVKTLFQQSAKVKTWNDKLALSITILKLKKLGVFNEAQVMELRSMYELVSGIWIVAETKVKDKEVKNNE